MRAYSVVRRMLRGYRSQLEMQRKRMVWRQRCIPPDAWERGLMGGITLTDEAERRSFGTNTPSVCQRLDSFDFSLTRALEPCPLRGRGEAGGTRTGINASDARIPTDMRRYDGQTDHGTLTPQRGAAPPGCAGPGDHCMEPCRMEERRPMVLGQ